MSEASLRPGRELSWLAALRERLLANVSASSAAITAYVGSFLHDIDQARMPPGPPCLRPVMPVHCAPCGQYVRILRRNYRCSAWSCRRKP